MAAYDPVGRDARPLPLQFPMPVMDDPGERVRRMMQEKFMHSTPELYVEPEQEEDFSAVDIPEKPKLVPDVTRRMQPSTAGTAVADAQDRRAADKKALGDSLDSTGPAEAMRREFESGAQTPDDVEFPTAPQAGRAAGAGDAVGRARRLQESQTAAAKEKADAEAAVAQGKKDRAAVAARAPAVAVGERRAEAKATGLNVDPKALEGQLAGQVRDFRAVERPDFQQDLADRQERAATAKDAAAFAESHGAWLRQREALVREYNKAVEDGNERDALDLAQQLQANKEAEPQPTSRMLGGKTLQEIEEPVSVTLEKLPEAERKALKRHLLDSYRRDSRDPDATGAEERAQREIAGMYDGLSPAERLETMMADAQRVMSAPKTPTVVANIDTLPGGRGAGIGDNAKNEDMDPADLRRAGRDVYSGFPMMNEPGRRGGTFVQNPDGAWGARMPAPAQAQAAMLTDEQALPLNPTEEQMTPQWREQMKFAGMTLGLNPQGFDNEGAFIAAAQKLLERHRQRAAKYDTIPVVTGGYRATPNAATKQKTADDERYRATREFIRTYPFSPDGSDALQQKLLEASNAGNVAKVAELKKQIRQEHEMSRAQAAKTFTKRQTETSLMNNPNVAPAMFRESLAQAGNDPAAIAAVYRQFGMSRQADQVLARENQRVAVEGEARRREAEIGALERKGDKDEGPLAGEVIGGGMQLALDQAYEDDILVDTPILTFMTHHNQVAGKGNEITPEEAAIRLARNMLATNPAAAWNRPVVKVALQNIAKGYQLNKGSWAGATRAGLNLATGGLVNDRRTAFINEVERKLGKGLAERAGQWWDANAR